jgi:hypothetical protein
MSKIAGTVSVIALLLPNLAAANTLLRCSSGPSCQASACGANVEDATRRCQLKCPGAKVNGIFSTSSDCTLSFLAPQIFTPVSYPRR